MTQSPYRRPSRPDTERRKASQQPGPAGGDGLSGRDAVRRWAIAVAEREALAAKAS